MISNLTSSPEYINTSIVPTCFTCLSFQDYIPSYWTGLDTGRQVTLNDDVRQIGMQLIVSDFSNLQPPLLDGQINSMSCYLRSDFTIGQRNIFTLGKKCVHL